MLVRAVPQLTLLALALLAMLLLPVGAQASASVLADFPARAGCMPAQADDCASGISGVSTVEYRFFGRANAWLTNPMIVIYAPDGVTISPASVTMRHSASGASIPSGCGAPVSQGSGQYAISCLPTFAANPFTFGSGEGIRVAFPASATPSLAGNAVVAMRIADSNFGGLLGEPTPWAVQLRSDLSVSLTGSGAAQAPTEITYAATVANAGPDATTATRVRIDLPSEAGITTSTVDGTDVTCSPVVSADARRQQVTCPAGAIASGAARVVRVTVRFALGERGLISLPATRTTTVSAAPGSGSEAADPVSANDSASLAVTIQPVPATPLDTCRATGGVDALSGCAFGSPVWGGGGNDAFAGGAGIDIFYGGPGLDAFTGAAGADWFSGGASADSASGDDGDDALYGGDAADRLVGGDGADRLIGGSGAGRLIGATGADVIVGGPGNDLVRGGADADRVFCGAGIDVATGDAADDVVACRDGAGGDWIVGGEGRDMCIGDRGDRFATCERIVRP